MRRSRRRDGEARGDDSSGISQETVQTYGVAGWTLFSRVTGLLRVAVAGAILGPTFFANIFQATNTVPNLTYNLMAGSVLTTLIVPLLVEALDTQPAFREQPEQGATYAEKIDPAERRLDPSRPATELAATVRGLTPHIGAYLETAGGDRLGVKRARAVAVSVKTGSGKAEWGVLLVGCCRGALRLEVVQPPGGKPMPVDAYLRGHSLPKL